MLILLVSGSRDLVTRDQEEFIRADLDDFLDEHGPFTLFHGACTRRGSRELAGADRFAHFWGLDRTLRGVRVERRPADWARWGYSAGPRRNQAMMDEARTLTGLDQIWLRAYPLGVSKGTRGMIRIAEDAKLQDRIKVHEMHEI